MARWQFSVSPELVFFEVEFVCAICWRTNWIRNSLNYAIRASFQGGGESSVEIPSSRDVWGRFLLGRFEIVCIFVFPLFVRIYFRQIHRWILFNKEKVENWMLKIGISERNDGFLRINKRIKGMFLLRPVREKERIKEYEEWFMEITRQSVRKQMRV